MNTRTPEHSSTIYGDEEHQFTPVTAIAFLHVAEIHELRDAQSVVSLHPAPSDFFALLSAGVEIDQAYQDSNLAKIIKSPIQLLHLTSNLQYLSYVLKNDPQYDSHPAKQYFVHDLIAEVEHKVLDDHPDDFFNEYVLLRVDRAESLNRHNRLFEVIAPVKMEQVVNVCVRTHQVAIPGWILGRLPELFYRYNLTRNSALQAYIDSVHGQQDCLHQCEDALTQLLTHLQALETDQLADGETASIILFITQYIQMRHINQMSQFIVQA